MIKPTLFITAVALLVSCNSVHGDDEIQVSSTSMMTIAITEAPTPPLLPTQADTPTLTGTPTVSNTPKPRIPITEENIRNIGELVRFGRGSGSLLYWRLDGKAILVATSTGLYTYDSSSLDLIKYIELPLLGNWGSLNTSFISSDGNIIGSISLAHDAVNLYSIADGSLFRTIIIPSPGSIAFSHDGKILATGSENNNITLWNTKDGSLLRVIKGHKKTTTSFYFSPDDSILISSSYDGQTLMWNLNDGSLIDSLPGYGILEFSLNGSFFATNYSSNEIQLLSISDRSIILKINFKYSYNGYGSLRDLAISADNKYVAAAFSSGTIHVWDLTDGALLATYIVNSGDLTSVVFSPDGSALAYGSNNGALGILSVPAGAIINHLEPNSGLIDSFAMSPDDSFFAFSTGGFIYLFRGLDGSPLGSIQMSTRGYIGELAFHPNRQILAAAGDPAGINIYSIPEINKLQFLNGLINLEFSYSGRFLASCWDEFRVWKWENTEYVSYFKGRLDCARVAISPDEEFFALSSFNGKVKIWSVSSGQIIKTIITGSTDYFVDLAFSPTGAYLATGTYDEYIRLWETENWTLKYTLPVTGSPVTFSPDGALLATLNTWDQTKTNDKVVYLWRTSDGLFLKKLQTPTMNIVTGLSFNADGTILASSSYDGTIRYWGIP